MCLCGFLWVFLAWDLLSFLDVWGLYFLPRLGSFQALFLQVLFNPFLFFLWDSKKVMLDLLSQCHRSLRLCSLSFSSLFLLYCSDENCSVLRFTGSFLGPLHSITVFFSTIISIQLFTSSGFLVRNSVSLLRLYIFSLD